MGGEYLPDQDDDEVEIARIEIRSTTGDFTSVYAQQYGTKNRYRVVDEYGGETLSGANERESTVPLTLGELEEFFLGAWPLLKVLEMNYDTDVERMLAFFQAHSQFYPGLDPLLRQRVIAAYPAAQSGPGDHPTSDEVPAAEEQQGPVRLGYEQTPLTPERTGMTSDPVYEIARYSVCTDEEVLVGHAQMFCENGRLRYWFDNGPEIDCSEPDPAAVIRSEPGLSARQSCAPFGRQPWPARSCPLVVKSPA